MGHFDKKYGINAGWQKSCRKNRPPYHSKVSNFPRFIVASENLLPISAYSPDVKGKSREASNSTGIPTSQAGKHMAVFIDSCWHPSVYKMSVDDAEKLGKDLELKKVVMGSLTRIKAQNKGCSIDYWDEEHPNEVTDPYETYLFRADHVLITADALNTLSNSLYLG
ncbi:hypothetical protein AX774_g5895 [Zancudomyces culisetae]|uniref:Uncharacterized protein n=1 Tax=Zancudomyces culisetae TaxID=1213189 RepID=A0A1R1PI55_ZANCU|nr:hypothetical protein AX774_g5895 [Zancudomyces culisetae]|eukprot:OMH80660.1 hypothetical protein AX774_g5895 [Zancudomyces culisetae]